MKRAVVLAVAVLTLPAASCGGGEKTVSEESLRDCLANGGLSFGRPGGAGAGLGNVSPDFVATLPDGGGRVSLVVEGTAEKARRKAADVRGALQAFGVTGADDRVITGRNAIAVFERSPAGAHRETVASCLEG